MPPNQRDESLAVDLQTQAWVGSVFGEEPFKFQPFSNCCLGQQLLGLVLFPHQWFCVCRDETGMCVILASVFTVGGDSEPHLIV